MLITWTTRALFESGSSTAPWNVEGSTIEDATNYFFNDIIGMESVGDDGQPTRIIGANVGYNFLIQMLIYLCIGFGKYLKEF